MKKFRIVDHLPVVSQIGLGSIFFGSSISGDDAFAIIDRYVKGGGNLLDTAHVYAAWLPDGAGASERTLGEWLRRTGARNEVVVSTKGGHPPMDNVGVSRLRPEEIERDLSESLVRLGVETIDLYWLHRDDPLIPVGEIMDALARHISSGSVVAIGASNWSGERLAAANAYAAEHDLPGFVASQIGYCLAEADAEMQGTMGGLVYMTPEYGESMRKLNIPLFAYTSQGAGFFSGRFDWQNARDERDGKAWFLKQLFGNEYNKERYNRVQTLACELEVSPTALALTWLLRQPHPTLPLIGPGSLEQLEDSLSAADIELSNEQCNWLNLKDRPSE